jgi:hypothetical protein
MAPMRKPVWVWMAVALFCVPGLAGQSGPDKTASQDKLQPLAAFLGHWKSQGEFLKTPYMPAGKVSGDTRCAWSAFRDAMVCDQKIQLPSGLVNQLTIYTFNPKTVDFEYYTVNFDGGPAQSGRLTIKGNTWTYSGDKPPAAGETDFRTVNVFTSAHEVKYEARFSKDGAHWTEMLRGVERRAP